MPDHRPRWADCAYTPPCDGGTSRCSSLAAAVAGLRRLCGCRAAVAHTPGRHRPSGPSRRGTDTPGATSMAQSRVAGRAGCQPASLFRPPRVLWISVAPLRCIRRPAWSYEQELQPVQRDPLQGRGYAAVPPGVHNLSGLRANKPPKSSQGSARCHASWLYLYAQSTVMSR